MTSLFYCVKSKANEMGLVTLSLRVLAQTMLTFREISGHVRTIRQRYRIRIPRYTRCIGVRKI